MPRVSNTQQQYGSWHWQDARWHDKGAESWCDCNQAWIASCDGAPEQEKGWQEEATETWYESEQALVRRKRAERAARERSHDKFDASKNPMPAAPADHTQWIFKAEEYFVDGNWYVELASNTWKLVTGPLYCRLCDMEVDDEQDHAGSAVHRIKVARKDEARLALSASLPQSVLPRAVPRLPQAPDLLATPTCQSSAPPHRLAPLPQPATAPQETALPFCEAQLRDWEELTPDGFRRCKACDKYLDGKHEEQAGHKERVTRWMQYRITQISGFPAPQEPWLAWVPDESRSGDRQLKCLLCQKWADAQYPASHSLSQPAPATSWHHSGSPEAPAGSKDHQKKLRCYEWQDLGPIKEERSRYHPEGAEGLAGAAPVSPAAAGQVGSASALLPPWKAALDSEGRTYYYNYHTREARWQMPVMNPLPAGWEFAFDPEQNQVYYYHVATGKCQWKHPAEPEVVD